MSLNLTHILPEWMTWLLIGGLLAVLAHGTVVLSRKKISPRWLAFLSGWRLLIVGVFLLVLLQPVVSFTQSVEQLPELMVLIDSSRSMDQKGEGGSAGTRLNEVLAALQKTDLVSELGRRYRLSWFSFDSTAFPIEAGSLASVQPVGSSTRYAESLTAAWNQMRAVGKTPGRVLLVSDGNDLGQADPVEIARSLGLVIDTMGPNSKPREGSAQVVIADVQCARRVLLGSETHFRVTLSRFQGGKEQSVTLRLSEDGKKVWDQEVPLKLGQTETILTLAHRPASIGTKQYEFQVREAGQAASASKPYPLAVQVVDSKYEVLVLEDTWRWEFKYLRRLLEEDPSFRFTALLSRGKGAFMQFGSPDRRVNLVGFPQGRAELEAFDTFILGDVDPGRWPPNLAAILSQLVTEEGKSLVVVAGPNLANLADVPDLYRLLPVELTRESGTPVGGPVEVRFGPDSGTSPFFFQIRSGEMKLPAVDQIYPPRRKRPAATVLLEAAKHANSYGNLIVIAEHTVGRGRVLFLGTDTLWKWQTLAPVKEGPTPYRLFWQQAFRALTPARSNLGGTQLWLQANRTRGEVGRPTVLEAEIQSVRPLPYAKIQATVELPDNRRLPLAFAADSRDPQKFRAEFEPVVAGPHSIKAAVLADGKPLGEGSTVIHVEESRGEQNDRGVDHANLSRIAAATGGKTIDPHRPESWPAPDERSLPMVTRERTVDLWNNFTLLLILCGLLAIDWVIRIMKGFV